MEPGPSRPRPPPPNTVEDIFTDYTGRRAGLIRALTQDVAKVYMYCDPEKDNLCLYGYPDETWQVTLPSEKVPTILPDPTLGINFARDNMTQTDWLYLVSVHSDSWLYAVAFFNGAKLNNIERGRLFGLINGLPTVLEVTRDWQQRQQAKSKKGKSSEASSSKSSSTRKRKSPAQSKGTSSKMVVEEGNEEQHQKTLCGSCGGPYSGDEFWIACDFCELWYHGMCVSITPTMAEKINKYECPFCALKRIGPIPNV